MNSSEEILVVDDTTANLRLLSQILIGHGYRVRVASNGRRALESVQLALPNLVLLDIKMPGMSGYEVCEVLKQNDQTCNIPIIFISALDDVQDKLRGFSAGGLDYITKPFQVEEVLARVETHLKLRKLQQDLQAANERMHRELFLAGHMQANFRPHEMPCPPGWQLAAALQPARETSGDFYDLFPLPGGKLGLIMADVVDKGVAAALFMVLSWSLMREGINLYPEQPQQVLCEVNRKILSILENLEYVTAFLGVLDPATGLLTYANAGQDPPLLFHPSADKAELLSRTGLALGISGDHDWKQACTQIEPGDVLLLYTDGLTEACDSTAYPFGLNHLQNCARKLISETAEEMKQGILSEIKQYLGEEPPQDDVTLLVVKRE